MIPPMQRLAPALALLLPAGPACPQAAPGASGRKPSIHAAGIDAPVAAAAAAHPGWQMRPVMHCRAGARAHAGGPLA